MSRATLIKTVHVACRSLGIDGETRRELQAQVTGKASILDMTDADLKRVIDALKARGFKPSGGVRPKRGASPRGDLRFCHVLWGKLVGAGVFTVAGHAGLNGFARTVLEQGDGATILNIDALQDHRQIARLIEVLKDRCARAGIAL